MIQVVINPVGLIITLIAGLVYYQIWDVAGGWLLLSCIGLHFMMAYFTKRVAMSMASRAIGTLAEECQKLAELVKKLVKENKELSRKLGVKDNP